MISTYKKIAYIRPYKNKKGRRRTTTAYKRRRVRTYDVISGRWD